MSLESLANKYTASKTSTSTTGGGLAGLAAKYSNNKTSKKADLTTSEGLYNVAEQQGGAVAKSAKQITGEEPTVFSKIEGGLKKGLGKTLDIISRPNYAVASAVKNVIDKNPTTTFEGGLKSGITGKTKHTFSDVLEEGGWKPETTAGKVVKGATGFALDVLLDPTTYVTFGAGTGVKIATKAGTRTLSKEGSNLLAKGLARNSLTDLEKKAIETGLQKGATTGERKLYEKAIAKTAAGTGEETIKNAIATMAEKSPEMYKKFIDQGGIKFFGNSLISGGRIAGVAKLIPGMPALDEASQPIRNALGSLFNRDVSAKFGKLPNEYTQLQQKFLDLGKVKSQEALDNVINIAKENKLTADEAGIISNAIENKLPLADDRLENARRLIEQGLGRNLKAEQKAGINVGELPNYVPHMLLDTEVKNIPFKPEGVRVSLGSKKERTIGKLADDTIGKGDVTSQATIQEINSAFGKDFFDPNIVNTAAIRSVASARAVAAKEFLTEVAQKFGTKAETAPTGYVKAGAKELEGLVFHPAIAEQIDKFGKRFIGDEGTNQLLKAFDKAQNLWKASVTSIFPAFHGRNAISNVFQNFLDIGSAALSPAKHALSAVMLKQNADAIKLEKTILQGGEVGKKAKAQLDELLNKPVLTDDFGKKWTFGEIRKEIKNRNIAFSDEFTGFMDIRENIASKLEKATSGQKVKKGVQAVNPFSQDNIAFKAGRKIGNAVEQQARILNFMTNLEKTGDVVTAAERTKQFLFDYTNLSDFEKNVMRRLIPFYTFTRKNLELQVGQLTKQPGKLATEAKIFTNISKAASDSTLTEEETNNLPSYLQEGLGIVWDRKGDDVTMINSLGTPVEQVFSALKDNSLLGSLSPVIAVPLQVAIGKHFFFDRDLKDVNDATPYKDAPQFIKDYIGLAERKNKNGTTRYIALNPTRLFILNNIPPSSRVVQTIGQLQDENVSGKLKVLRQLTGIKPYGVNLTEQAAYKEKTKMRELQDLLDKSGVAPTFKRSFIPKDK